MDDAFEKRRRQMLAELIGDMRGFHRRRQFRRKVAAAAALALATTSATLAWSLLGPKPSFSPPPESSIAECDVAAPGTRIELVHTDEAVARRWQSGPSRPTPISIVDDQSLLDALAQLDRPAGLVRLDHQVRLAYHGAPAVAPSGMHNRTGG